MKSFLVSVSLVLAAILAPRVASAGCPQIGGCDAVIAIEARLEGGPSCVRIERTEPENGCVCQGTVYVANDCDFEVVAPEVDWNSGNHSIAPHTSQGIDRDQMPAGKHHDVIALEADGTTFQLVIDYEVAFREMESGGCSVTSGAAGSSAALGTMVAAAALMAARRRRR